MKTLFVVWKMNDGDEVIVWYKELLDSVQQMVEEEKKKVEGKKRIARNINNILI